LPEYLLVHKHPDNFVQDDEYRWCLVIRDETVLELDSNCWVNDYSFEQSLQQAGCLLDCDSNSVLVKIPEGCKILLIAAARLLALLNQLAALDQDVTLDFTDCEDTKSFLSREAFLDHLDRRVKVKPERPSVSKTIKPGVTVSNRPTVTPPVFSSYLPTFLSR
jgi:hypothetical protein